MKFKNLLLLFLIVIYFIFAFYVSSYNTYSYLHWDGSFWGWESSLIQDLNLFDSKLYLDKILVYPPFSTFLIKLLSESQTIFGFLFIENFINYFSFLICGIVSYKIFSRKFDFTSSTIIAIFFVFYSSTIVNPITYNSISLALSFLIYYYVFYKNDLVIPSILLSILLLTKQTYALGIAAGLIVVFLLHLFKYRKITKHLYILFLSFVVHTITILLLDIFQLIDFSGYFENVYFNSASQKGGVLILIKSMLVSMFRIIFDRAFLLTIPLTFFYIYLEKFIINKKLSGYVNLKNNSLVILSIVILLPSFLFLLFTNFTLNIDNIPYIFALKRLITLFIIQYVIYLFLVKLSNKKLIINYDQISKFIFCIAFSFLIHLSSKVSHLMSYPNLLMLIALWYFIRNSRLKTFNYLIIGLIFPILVIGTTSGRNISQISVFDEKWGYVDYENQFSKGVKFYKNETFNKLNKYYNKSFITIPENPPLNKLFGTSYNINESKIPNKFVDMYPDNFLNYELKIFKNNNPNYIFIINPDSWKNWYHDFVRSNSASEKFNDYVIKYLSNNYTFKETILTAKMTKIDIYEKN